MKLNEPLYALVKPDGELHAPEGMPRILPHIGMAESLCSFLSHKHMEVRVVRVRIVEEPEEKP